MALDTLNCPLDAYIMALIHHKNYALNDIG